MTDTQAPKKDVVPTHYRDKYKDTGGTCGDFIATKLQSVGKDGSLDSIKAENGIERDRWSTFNPGMQRMNLANVLRGRYLKGESITILGKQYNAKHQSEEFNFTLEDTPASLARAADILELQNNDRTIAALQKLFFPAAPKGKTAEEREQERAAKAAEKQKAKDLKAAKSALTKAQAAEKKANEALEKATVALDEAKAASKAASKAAMDAGDEKVLTKANEKVGKLEDKVDDAAAKADAATAATKAAQATVDELSA